jgi:EmrB/QacA subfamily drug resistance transporter
MKRTAGNESSRPPAQTGSPALGVIVACAAHFVIGVDGLAVAIALPSLQADLHVPAIDAQWVLTAYGLSFGGCLLLGGRLGDLYGRRKLLIAGMATFAAGAVLAGIAPELHVLIAARAIQGLGAAAAVPAALALIGSLFPPGPERTRALSLLAAIASAGVVSGVLLGGAITELAGWRCVFLVVAPPALLAALAAPRMLPEARAEEREGRPDIAGAALVTAGMVGLLFGVTRIEHAGAASLLVVAPLLVGMALLATFVAWEQRSAAPLVRFGVLSGPRLRVATLGGAINSVAFTSIVFVGTLYLQQALDYSPLKAGLALLPVDAVSFVVGLTAGAALARRSPRAVLGGSFLLTALALLWLARAPVPASYVSDLMVPLVVLGISLTTAFVVLTQEAVADVHADEKGLASGIFETANHLLGGAAGVALYATVITAATAGAADSNRYRAAFVLAAGLAALGIALSFGAHKGASPRPPGGRTGTSSRAKTPDIDGHATTSTTSENSRTRSTLRSPTSTRRSAR